MRATLNELMEKLGVGYVPGAGDSVPFISTDGEKGMTCSAEIRMGMDLEEVEGEIQLLHDAPADGKGPMEHICGLVARPAHEGQWTTVSFRFRGAPYGKDVYGWEEKACDFFRLMLNDIQAGLIPDADDMLDNAFHKRERFADQRGGGGGKAPKIKPGKLLNPGKGGRGF